MYIIGFDPATKTFAYCFFYLDDSYFANYDKYMNKIKKLRELYLSYVEEFESISVVTHESMAKLVTLQSNIKKVLALASEWEKELKPMIRIISAETVDLVPGVLNSDITPAQRIKPLGVYMEKIKAIVVKHCALNDLHVYVELQMKINSKSNIVANALMGMLYTSNLFTIDSRIKNTAFFGDRNKICNFIRNTSRGQNKSQSISNLNTVIERFTVVNTSIFAVTDHIADAFMQVMAAKLLVAQGREDEVDEDGE